jgi:alpha-tubulin suppressor-like RCC1 family protein
MLLKSDGSLWGMGYNYDGELGDGTFSFNSPYGTNRPERIVAGGVTAIAAGRQHSLFIKNDGSLWATGYDHNGQLGDGVYGFNAPYGTNQPEQIVAANVTSIAAGDYHSLFIKSDGSLWAMGHNFYGELGDGTFGGLVGTNNVGTNLPEQVVTGGVTAVTAGFGHSLFIKTNGSLWGMGYNGSGELGDGTYNNTNRPEQIVANGVTAIAAGAGHSLFVKSDGSLWGMGGDDEGELGTGNYYISTNRPILIVASNVMAVAAGEGHSLFIKRDGSLWGMGGNLNGQLGDGTQNTVYSPKQIVASGVTAVAAGNYYTIFTKSDGSLWGMGQNTLGQLGDGTNSNTNRPKQILAGPPPGYNRISSELLGDGNLRLSFVGNAGANYALDGSFALAPPNWVPQVTNAADGGGVLVYTNTPDPATNNFWRIRSVP